MAILLPVNPNTPYLICEAPVPVFKNDTDDHVGTATET